MHKVIYTALQKAISEKAQQKVRTFEFSKYKDLLTPSKEWNKTQYDLLANLMGVSEKLVYSIFQYGGHYLKHSPNKENLKKICEFLGLSNCCNWEPLEDLLMSRFLNDFLKYWRDANGLKS